MRALERHVAGVLTTSPPRTSSALASCFATCPSAALLKLPFPDFSCPHSVTYVLNGRQGRRSYIGGQPRHRARWGCPAWPSGSESHFSRDR